MSESLEQSKIFFRKRETVTTNSDSCSGCQICQMICSLKHDHVIDIERSRIRVTSDSFKGASKIIVCAQCHNAPCYYACPECVIEFSKSNGNVLINKERCNGCRSARALLKVTKEARYLLENDPRREWTTRARVLEYINKYRKKNMGCFGCPVQCFAFLEIPDVSPSATHCVDYYYYSAATEYYGKTLERDQAISEGYVLANRFGLDTYEFSKMKDLLKDLFDKDSLMLTQTSH